MPDARQRRDEDVIPTPHSGADDHPMTTTHTIPRMWRVSWRYRTEPCIPFIVEADSEPEAEGMARGIIADEDSISELTVEPVTLTATDSDDIEETDPPRTGKPSSPPELGCTFVEAGKLCGEPVLHDGVCHDHARMCPHCGEPIRDVSKVELRLATWHAFAALKPNEGLTINPDGTLGVYTAIEESENGKALFHPPLDPSQGGLALQPDGTLVVHPPPDKPVVVTTEVDPVLAHIEATTVPDTGHDYGNAWDDDGPDPDDMFPDATHGEG